MTYQLKFSDLDYYRPRHDEILPSDILNLSGTILPNAKATGFCSNYTDSNESLVLYLDEKDDKFGNRFIGGILVSSLELHKIKRFMLKFKKQFKPELTSTSWMIKGSGKHVKAEADTYEEVVTRWILWSKHLKKCDFQYNFHSCNLNLHKYLPHSTNKSSRNIETYQVMYEHLLDSLEMHKHANIKVVTDNIKDAQLEAFNAAITKYKISKKIPRLWTVEPIKKEKFNTFDCAALEFVDILVYAMYRFITPSGQNILADFEAFSYYHANNNKTTFNNDLALHVMAAKYYIISDIYHHIRQNLTKNIFSPSYDDAISSMCYIGKKIHRNFASYVDNAIFNFCNVPGRGISFDATNL